MPGRNIKLAISLIHVSKNDLNFVYIDTEYELRILCTMNVWCLVVFSLPS